MVSTDLFRGVRIGHSTVSVAHNRDVIPETINQGIEKVIFGKLEVMARR